MTVSGRLIFIDFFIADESYKKAVLNADKIKKTWNFFTSLFFIIKYILQISFLGILFALILNKIDFKVQLA